MKRFTVLLSTLLLLAGWACAASLAEGVEWRSLWKAEGPLSLPISDEPTTETLGVRGLSLEEGEGLCLRFKARLHTAQPAGWNEYLGIAWNGVALNARTAENTRRVLNRSDAFATTNPRYPLESLVSERFGMPTFQVFFGPPEPKLDEIITDKEEGYWYFIDLSDFEEIKWENKLTFTNTALKEYWKGTPPAGCALVIEDLEVGAVSSGDLKALRRAHMLQRKPPGRQARPGERMRCPRAEERRAPSHPRQRELLPRDFVQFPEGGGLWGRTCSRACPK